MCIVNISVSVLQIMKLIILTLLYVTINCEDFELISKVRTPYLEEFTNYIDGAIISFQVPFGSSSVLFKFLAEETQSTMINCTTRKVNLYLKHGSLPAINPENSILPDNFKKISRSNLYYFEFESNQISQDFILTSPLPGSWYAIAFLSSENSNQQTLHSRGSQCYAHVEADLFTSTTPKIGEIVENNEIAVSIITNINVYYKFFVPKSVDHALLTVDKIVFGSGAQSLTIRVQSDTIPWKNNTIKSETIENNSKISFKTVENSWHFFEFFTTGTQEETSSFIFNVKYFFNINNTNDYEEYGGSVSKIYSSDHIENVIPYKQYDLVRISTTQTFSYSFDLRKKIETSLPIPVNLTSTDFTALKFQLNDITDTGGTLEIVLGFQKDLQKLEKNHKIIGCVRANSPEIPIWPNLCRHELTDTEAPLLVDESTDTATIQIPYPETGVWFATFKLFCGECEPCNCSSNCQQNFEACYTDCEATCTDAEICNNCGISCKEEIIATPDCSKCNCEGSCVKSETECDSSMLFDVTSFPCVEGTCGENGRCTLMVSDGVVFSSCVCSYNYRGWDCMDDTHAHSFWTVLLELTLLVLSNLFFLPSAFVAFRRRYYVEALVYLSICFFSTFYHACDAGENVASFCITKLEALQFADFFCALLSIWVTGIAIADLPSFWTPICHILGAIILAFITTINNTSVGVLAVPAPIGIIIIAISWYMKYRKSKGNFVNERYLYTYIPIGVAIVTTGLIIFASLETMDNYKYLHSLWHILMATAVIVVLPRPNTFQPETRC